MVSMFTWLQRYKPFILFRAAVERHMGRYSFAGGFGSARARRPVVSVKLSQFNPRTYHPQYAAISRCNCGGINLGNGLGALIPGPNVFYSFLIGNQTAGWLGGVVSLLGLVAPPCLLITGVAHLTNQSKPPAWMQRFYRAMSPITIGLMLATVWSIGRHFSAHYILLGLIAALLSIRTSLNPSWIILFAVLFGVIFPNAL